MAEAACQTHRWLMGCRHWEHSELFRPNESCLTKEKVDTRGGRHLCKRKSLPVHLTMLISAFKGLGQAISQAHVYTMSVWDVATPPGATTSLHNACGRMFETGALSCDVT